MLKFNPRRLTGLRGIENANALLRSHGFSPMIASRLLTYGLPHLNVKNLGRLCTILNCTPNDLFDWKPSPTAALPEGHALQSLVRDPTPAISEMLKDIPAEKLADLKVMIDELRSK